MFFHLLGIIIPTDDYFSKVKPPTSDGLNLRGSEPHRNRRRRRAVAQRLRGRLAHVAAATGAATNDQPWALGDVG